jgi:DNA-binding protein HU-beta
MNKQELLKVVTDKSGVSQKDAGAVLDAFIESITEVLKAKDKVTLVGFGVFETVERKVRIGRNPKTGAEIKIPATIRPKFKPGKTLKDAVTANKTEVVKKSTKIKDEPVKKDKKKK